MEKPETSQPRPRRIAIILPNLGGGGAERVGLASAVDLIAKGHEVDFVLARAEGDLLPLVPSGARVIDLGASRLLKALGPIITYLKREKPDVIHAIMWPMTVMAVVARFVSGSRARLMISDQIAFRPDITSWLAFAPVSLTTRLFYRFADIRVVCSNVAADVLAKMSGVSRDKFEVIYNPIMPPALVEASPEAEALWGKATERLITVGSFKPQKNHALLLRAFAQLDRPGSKLMILGEGPLRGPLEKQARELGISERVIMPGFFIDPWPYLASADVFVLSSDWEGFPLALAEGMYAGLRIVSTDCVSGPAEMLEGGRFGRLVPCGDAGALARAINGALDEPPRSEELRARADEVAGSAPVRRYTELLTQVA